MVLSCNLGADVPFVLDAPFFFFHAEDGIRVLLVTGVQTCALPIFSDSDRRAPADWGQESQASSWVEAWNSACLWRCPRGERPLVELYLEPGVFSERCTERLPFRVDCIHRLAFGEVSGHRVLIKRGPGNRGPTECGTTHEATSGMSS